MNLTACPFLRKGPVVWLPGGGRLVNPGCEAKVVHRDLFRVLSDGKGCGDCVSRRIDQVPLTPVVAFMITIPFDDPAPVGLVFAPSGGIPFGVFVYSKMTATTPAGETCCSEPMTTKRLADPQGASAREAHPPMSGARLKAQTKRSDR